MTRITSPGVGVANLACCPLHAILDWTAHSLTAWWDICGYIALYTQSMESQSMESHSMESHSLQLTWHTSQVQWVCGIHSQQVHKLRWFHGNWFPVYWHLPRNAILHNDHAHPLLVTEARTVGGKVLQGHSSSTIVKGEPQLHRKREKADTCRLTVAGNSS